MADFASESGHWYALDGTPCYTIVGKNGVERNTTLRDARKLNLCPSVTGIIRCAAAPALERWKRNQVLLAALTLPRQGSEPEIDWLRRVEQDWQEQGRKAADKGTQIHAGIEKHYRREPPDLDVWDHVKAAVVELNDRCGNIAWASERSFAHPMGYGGKTDLHHSTWVIDTKSKDGDLSDVDIYDEHCMQAAAYRRGLNVHGARCGILFVSRDLPKATLVEITEARLICGLAMFDALLAFWQAKNNYRPQVVAEAA